MNPRCDMACKTGPTGTFSAYFNESLVEGSNVLERGDGYCELTASPSPSMVILLFSLSELLSLRAEFGIELTKSGRRPEAVAAMPCMVWRR